jgi:hypothetical protein
MLFVSAVSAFYSDIENGRLTPDARALSLLLKQYA